MTQVRSAEKVTKLSVVQCIYREH